MEWHNVEDKLPIGQFNVLVFDGKEIDIGYVIKYYSQDTKAAWHVRRDPYADPWVKNITHWAELPPGPCKSTCCNCCK